MGEMDGDWPEWTEQDASTWLAVPGADDDKYSRGVLGALTGSDEYPGAAVLGVEAAMRAGVGMVRYLGPARAADFVLARRPETVTAAGQVQAWLIGSGMSAAKRDARVTKQIRGALAEGVPTALDAGAVDLTGESTGETVITPHFRELSAALAARDVSASADDIAADPGLWAPRAARALEVTVLLKGHTTFVASPDGERMTASTGPSWLATAGTGDVLGGILGALLATHAAEIAEQGSHAMVCLAGTAAVLHGLAADRASAGGPITALDVAEALPASVANLLGRR